MDKQFILQFIINSINDNSIFIDGITKARLDLDKNNIVIEDENENIIILHITK